MVSGKVGADWACEKAATNASGSAANGARKDEFNMVKKQSNGCSHRLPRRRSSVMAAHSRERTTALLAGIRADRATFITFPGALRHPVVEK
jgi:hypothetical protein